MVLSFGYSASIRAMTFLQKSDLLHGTQAQRAKMLFQKLLHEADNTATIPKNVSSDYPASNFTIVKSAMTK